jgi:elongation factor G
MHVARPAGQAWRRKSSNCSATTAARAISLRSAAAHRALIDQIVEEDEDLLARYLDEGADPSPDELHAPFEKALRAGHLIPILFVSAKTGAGIPQLLDVLANWHPIPAEGNPPPFYKGELNDQGEAFTPNPTRRKHVLAHVFKVVSDPFIGKLGVFRVHQGTIRKDSQLFVGDAKRPFKVGHLYRLQGKDYVEVDRWLPGDIGAIAKVDEIEFDCVLHDSHDEDHIHLKPLEFPQPMQGLAVRRRRKADEQRLFDVLHKLESKTPASRSNAIRRPTRRSFAASARCICAPSFAHGAAVQDRTRHQAAADRLSRTITARPKDIAGTRSRAAARASSAKSCCASSRSNAAPASSSSISSRAASFPACSWPRSRKACARRWKTASSAVSRCTTCASSCMTASRTRSTARTSPSSPRPQSDDRSDPRRHADHPRAGRRYRNPRAGRGRVGDLAGDLSSKRGQVTGTQPRGAGSMAIGGKVPLAELDDYQGGSNR